MKTVPGFGKLKNICVNPIGMNLFVSSNDVNDMNDHPQDEGLEVPISKSRGNASLVTPKIGFTMNN